MQSKSKQSMISLGPLVLLFFMQSVLAQLNSNESSAKSTDAKHSQKIEEPTPSPAREIPKREFTWAEIESILEKLRAERKTRHLAIEDLESWYTYLAHPAYSKSKDLPSHLIRLEAWQKELPESPTPWVVMAKVHLLHAWQARGDVFANEVTAEGGKLFDERVQKAHRALKNALEIGVKDGEPFDLLLNVAIAEGWTRDRTRAVLDDGRKLDPTFYNMYQTMAIYLMPRWHGRPGEVEEFASEILNALGGDDGLEAFGKIAYRINQFDNDLIFWGAYDRKALAKAALVLAKRYPQARNLPCFAALCTIAANDHEAACQVAPFVHFPDAPKVPFWGHHSRMFFAWTGIAKVPTGETDWLFGSHNGSGSIAFVPNSKLIWCGQGFTGRPVALLDFGKKSLRFELEVEEGGSKDFVYDHTKMWVAAALSSPEYKGWCVWDLKKKSVRSIRTIDDCVAVVINPALPQILWADGNVLNSMNMETNEKGPQISLDSRVRELAFCTNGELLVVRTAKSTTVWKPSAGQREYDIGGTDGKNWCTRILDFDAQRRVWAISGHRGPVQFSADGRDWKSIVVMLSDRSDYSTAILSPDKKLIAVPILAKSEQDPNPIELWSVETGKIIKTLPGHWSPVRGLAFTHDSKTLASIGMMDGVIKFWSLE